MYCKLKDVEERMTILFKTLCMMKICSCPRGTHAWHAIQSVSEHMIPHDPGSRLRAERYLDQSAKDIRDIRIQMGRDELTGEPWRRAQDERSTY